MSVQAIGWALSQNAKPAAAKLLLIAIANYADERNQCWPSKARLARDCSSDKSTICRYLRQLETAGLVHVRERVMQGAHVTSMLTLLIEEGSGSGATRGSGTDTTRVVGQVRHKPSIEPSLEPSGDSIDRESLASSSNGNGGRETKTTQVEPRPCRSKNDLVRPIHKCRSSKRRTTDNPPQRPPPIENQDDWFQTLEGGHVRG